MTKKALIILLLDLVLVIVLVKGIEMAEDYRFCKQDLPGIESSYSLLEGCTFEADMSWFDPDSIIQGDD